jgi:5-formyltetrahydrofolate cyclo-ligase
VLDRETIVFRAFETDTPLVKTGFGTTGPGEDAEVLDPDILLVPLSVFDGKGQRVGYGAGHYDRAIARLHGKGRFPILIGVAFDCQEVPSVPAEPHDVPLHAILTESGLRWFSGQPLMSDNGQTAL